MRADVPPLEVVGHMFWLGAGGADEPGMRRMAECVSALRPAIERLGRDYGDRCVMGALTAIAAHTALETNEMALLAAIFRSSARVLDLEARGDLDGPRRSDPGFCKTGRSPG